MGLFQLCVLCMDFILWHGPLSEGVGFLECHLNGDTKLSLHSSWLERPSFSVLRMSGVSVQFSSPIMYVL